MYQGWDEGSMHERVLPFYSNKKFWREKFKPAKEGSSSLKEL